ncbi:hypothetical protein DBV05_g8030 [Lasiodiplodia theobromae]|uniref:Uncharacterized protein n=1 Tax=Lasiodiplodia theobromae TaxID=45133 RepID=A0A5N5D6C0_9PEZI|nr:hypothetical protein DBV05_g8030 [Lasiodiplodia theobromae]
MERPYIDSFASGGQWSWLAVSQIVVGGLSSAVAADVQLGPAKSGQIVVGGLSSVIVEVSKETYHFGSSYANSIWKQKSAE